MLSIRWGGFACLVALAAAACVTGRASGPEAIARLEPERSSNPRSEPVLRPLGLAYYKSGNSKDARTMPEQRTVLDPRERTAALYLGLATEAQNAVAAADRAYASCVQCGWT